MPEVQAMINAFYLSSNTTGLQVNPSKASIYCCGIVDSIKEAIGNISGFTCGD